MSDTDSDSDASLSRQQLCFKVIKIRQWYKDYLIKVNVNSVESSVNVEQPKLFKSMTRWHRNSHIADVVWKSNYDHIVPLLNIKSKMNLDKHLQRFLDKKAKSSRLMDQLRIPDFLDFLSTSIRELYQNLLDHDKDEYNYEFALMSGSETCFLAC